MGFIGRVPVHNQQVSTERAGGEGVGVFHEKRVLERYCTRIETCQQSRGRAGRVHDGSHRSERRDSST